MPIVFFTGFPGFLGSELLPRILQRSVDTTAVCLVQPKFADLARERARAFGNRIRLIEGDITAPLDVQTAEVIEVFHLAAIYDLSVSREKGMKINVEGTRNVLDFAERCPSLRRVHHVSTRYVSGRYDGVFHEDDLDVGQAFNNFYEETKFLAEVEVRKRSLPLTIYRPSIVVGDSTTGATQKFDGPYYLMQWLLRQPPVAVLPVVGRPSRYRVNVVPRDFIVAAIAELSNKNGSTCYQLADPAPLTVDEFIDVIARATRRHVVRLPLPRSVAKFGIDRIPGVYRLLRIPSAVIDYFVHPTTYDTTNAQRDLRLRVPRFSEYAERLVAFAEAHPEISPSGMA